MRTVHHVLGTIAAAFRRGSGKTSRPSPARNRARLALESLDPRLAPSSLVDTGNPDPTTVSTETNTTATVIGLAAAVNRGVDAVAPQLINFKGIEIVGGLYRFEGDVIDANPAGLTVTFGGEPDSLQGVTVTTDANGHFNKVLDVKTDGSDNGTASAQTVNAAGVASNIALTIIHAS